MKKHDLYENDLKTVMFMRCVVDYFAPFYRYIHLLGFIIYIIILPSVRLCALQSPLTLYPATDCAAATDISGVTGC